MTQTSAPVRRPRDRRQQIIASAARQFRAAGYYNVGITEIAEAVGITSAALYRHFAGKQDLLLATVNDAIDSAFAVWAQSDDLDELLEATCALPLTGHDVGVLWARETAHLPADTQRELRAKLLTAVEPVRAALTRARPELTADVVDVLLWAAIGVIAVGYQGIRIDSRRLQARLLEACGAICAISSITPRAPTPGARTQAPPGTALLPASRQEAILTAASRLFSARGYQTVGVDDIGAAAGITGATVYHHFANKSAILAAALRRCLEAMFFDLSGALDSSTTPGEALDKALSYFVRICVEHGMLISALQNEYINLPPAERDPLLQARSDYLAEWAALLARHRTELSDAEAEVLVRSAISSISSLLAIPHIRRRTTLDEELVAVGRAILGLEARG